MLGCMQKDDNSIRLPQTARVMLKLNEIIYEKC